VSSSWTESEAMDYLVGKIAAKAEHEGIPLSELERKMLHYSETDRTSPEMQEMRAEFRRHYDWDEFEQKIARLVHEIKIAVYAHGEFEKESWDQAVQTISGSDQYLFSLIHSIHIAEEVSFDSDSTPPKNKQWLIALVCIVVGSAVLALIAKYFGPKWSHPWW
jgi:hypothetical protein